MQNVVINIADIFERLKKALCLRNDADLARKLGESPKKLAVWKLRNTIPIDLLVSFCSHYFLDLEWVLTGVEKGEKSAMAADQQPHPPAINPRTAALAANYEALDDEDKRALERIAFSLAQSQKKMKKKTG